ncbi:MAG: ribosome maturation factor RimM [Gammaproteobacteria bacterium]|nr:ribosome maturation factor RimM [Gammaproteobacteria bacterium]
MVQKEKDREAMDPVILGQISGLFGVMGWVKVYSYTEPREAILEYRDCLLMRDGEWQPVTFAEGKRHSKTVIVKLKGVDDRDAAAAYIGADIAVPRDKMPDPGEGHYYWSDLEGMSVVHRDGTVLGKVAYLLATGANDVLVVQGEKEVLIPFLPEEVILDVDQVTGVIRVDWDWD